MLSILIYFKLVSFPLNKSKNVFVVFSKLGSFGKSCLSLRNFCSFVIETVCLISPWSQIFVSFGPGWFFHEKFCF